MISILVVDDNATCLTIVAAILKKWKYEVMTAKHGLEALWMLCIWPYDLVVADLHMPDINGLELQQHIKTEFQLPVVLISADDRKEVVHKGMENGASSFLVKPLRSEDLRNIWQYSVWWKKFKNPTILLELGLITPDQYNNLMTADRPNRRRPRRNNNANAAEHIAVSSSASAARDGCDIPRACRTKKLLWTRKLHTRFVEAILIIGYHRAVPTTILEVMNVPGLTREQVASHLQKYRKFMYRVLEEGSTNVECSDWIDLTYYSNHVSGNPNLLLLNQLRDEHANRNLATPFPQQENDVPVLGKPSSSILNPPASTTKLTPSGYKALPPFTEDASSSGTKNVMNTMLMQQGSPPPRGNTLVISNGMTTNYGSLSNAAAGGLGGGTSLYNGNMGHVSGSNTAPNFGKNLNCFNMPINQIGYYNQTNVTQENNYSGNGGFGGANNIFPLINHVGPSSAPLGTNLYSQQPFNVGGQGDMLFNGNNIQSINGGQQNYVQQVSNIGSPFGANQFRVSSVMYEQQLIGGQVSDFGNIGSPAADNYLPGFIPNQSPTNQVENEESEDNFWAEMMDTDYRGFDEWNDDNPAGERNGKPADVAADDGEEL